MTTTADTDELTLFEGTALEWHHEWYIHLTRTQPSRADQVLAWLHNHVFPFMRAMGCPSGGDLTREQFLGFQTWVADSARIDLGPAPEDPDRTVTSREAIELTGAARSTIQRARQRGAFPGATQEENRTWHIPLADLHAAGLLAGPLRRGRRGVPTNHQQQAEMAQGVGPHPVARPGTGPVDGEVRPGTGPAQSPADPATITPSAHAGAGVAGRGKVACRAPVRPVADAHLGAAQVRGVRAAGPGHHVRRRSHVPVRPASGRTTTQAVRRRRPGRHGEFQEPTQDREQPADAAGAPPAGTAD